MVELSQMPSVISPGLKIGSPIKRSVPIGAKLVFWALALLTLAALAVQFGLWQKKFDFAGPFASETNPPRHSFQIEVPKEGSTHWWRQPLIGDTSEKPFESRLGLQINGHPMEPAHSLHEAIRNGTTEGFSHWNDFVIFTLPPGMENAASTTATLRYSVRLRPWITPASLLSTILLGWLLYRKPIETKMRRSWSPVLGYKTRLAAMLLRIPFLLLAMTCGVGAAASMIFVGSSLYALASGWALPTTALIRFSPLAQWTARNEPYFGHALLMLAGLGMLANWVGSLNVLQHQILESDELRTRRLFRWVCFPVVACAFVFGISAMWAGVQRPGDIHMFGIGALIPLSDALAHLASAYDQARDGSWSSFAQRRPIAATFRSALLLFSGDSLSSMLLLQACLVAIATAFASYAVAIWRGVWAGVAFLGLTYIYARLFVPTALTESLGLFWALLSVPFFIDAFRSRSATPALVAFAMMMIALMTRMGSMFTVPALLIWLVWQFGNGVAAKLRIGVVAIGVLAGVLGLDTLLQKAYGTDQGSTGSNFSYVICGLSIGTPWNGCPALLAAQGEPLNDPEAVVARKLYAFAWQNFQSKPEIFFERLADAAGTFFVDFPKAIWSGYALGLKEPDWFFHKVLTAIFLAGLYLGARSITPAEIAFWKLSFLSIIASAALVYLDDGERTLAASHPLIALFLVSGMSRATLASGPTTPNARMSRYGTWGLIATVVLFASIPWMAHRLAPIEPGFAISSPDAQTALMFGGRRMTGWLVVADDVPLRKDIAAIHASDFEAIVRQSGVEDQQSLLRPQSPPLPFGLVYAPRTAGNSYLGLFIVPAEVMERRDVPAWRFTIERWPPSSTSSWYHVVTAEPQRP
jgi:hypothetical protein